MSSIAPFFVHRFPLLLPPALTLYFKALGILTGIPRVFCIYRLCLVFLPRVCHSAAPDDGGASPHPQQPVTRPREAVGKLQHRRRGAQRRYDGSSLPPGRHRGGRVAGEPKGDSMAGLGVLAQYYQGGTHYYTHTYDELVHVTLFAVCGCV